MKALTIAGSDCSGGAGIQADLKTFTVRKVYGMSVITALTAQNTCGVNAILDITPQMIEDQLEAVFTDIVPDAVKIGMVSVEETIRRIAKVLRKYSPKYIVLDPVMVATSGARLLSEDAVMALKEELLPLATLVTPNVPEAEVLWGKAIENDGDRVEACKAISKMTKGAVLLKGGHSLGNADDYLYVDGELICFEGKRIETANTHGTGCTLSAAITAQLAQGNDLVTSVGLAKDYITGALHHDLNLGKGNGPLNHAYCVSYDDK